MCRDFNIDDGNVSKVLNKLRNNTYKNYKFYYFDTSFNNYEDRRMFILDKKELI